MQPTSCYNLIKRCIFGIFAFTLALALVSCGNSGSSAGASTQSLGMLSNGGSLSLTTGTSSVLLDLVSIQLYH